MIFLFYSVFLQSTVGTMIGRDIKMRWKKFVISEGFQFYKGNKKLLVIESDFARILVRLDYAPVTRNYYPECTIILCELERKLAGTSDAMYNFFDFRTHELIRQMIDDAMIYLQYECLQGVAEYSEEDFKTLLEQHRAYFFPAIKKCLTREGFVEFCQRYPPNKMGLVCKHVAEWIRTNVTLN